MLFLLFWTSTVLFTWQSMGHGFYLNYLKLCSEDEQSFYGVGTTCGLLNNDNFHFGVE